MHLLHFKIPQDPDQRFDVPVHHQVASEESTMPSDGYEFTTETDEDFLMHYIYGM